MIQSELAEGIFLFRNPNGKIVGVVYVKHTNATTQTEIWDVPSNVPLANPDWGNYALTVLAGALASQALTWERVAAAAPWPPPAVPPAPIPAPPSGTTLTRWTHGSTITGTYTQP